MPLRSNHGYTFFEILVVLVMASIVLVIVVSRVTNTDVDLAAQAEVLKAHIRYAQARAINSSSVWGLHCDGTSAYWLFNNGSIANKIHLPSADTNTIDLAAAGFTLESFTLAFDGWGIPYTDAAASTGQALTAADAEADLTLSRGSDSKTITITPNTGFIP
jgi:MSHA pilin protein MshC